MDDKAQIFKISWSTLALKTYCHIYGMSMFWKKKKFYFFFFWFCHSQICETACGAKPTFFFLKTIQPRKSGFDELPRFYDFSRTFRNLYPIIYLSTKILKRFRKTSFFKHFNQILSYLPST
jgi:hypothetical protein